MSAQQWAPDAYISLCKSTTQDTLALRGYTRLYMHAPRDACISFARVQEMRAPLLSMCVPRCARPCFLRASPNARPPASRDAKMRAPLLLATQRCARLGSYRNRDLVSSIPFFQPRSLPRSGTSVKGGSTIKEPPPPSVKPPGRILSPQA